MQLSSEAARLPWAPCSGCLASGLGQGALLTVRPSQQQAHLQQHAPSALPPHLLIGLHQQQFLSSRVQGLLCVLRALEGFVLECQLCSGRAQCSSTCGGEVALHHLQQRQQRPAAQNQLQLGQGQAQP